MNRGGKFLGCSALLAIAACGGESGKLEIRAMKTPLAQGKKPVNFRVAEANSQLALGNAALALEAYRLALREDPQSVDALAGMAVCYERMGRFDLSRRQYEAALAIEPGNPTILAMLAASLDQQGMRAEAASVRAEIQIRAAAVAALAPAPAVAPAPPVAVAATVAPAPPVAAVVAQAVETALPKPGEMPAPMLTAAPLAAGVAIVAPALAVAAFAPDDPPAARPAPAPKPAGEELALTDSAKVGRSVTVTLPAARPAAKAPIAAQPATQLAALDQPTAKAQAAKMELPAPAPAPAPAPVRTVQEAPVALPPPVRRLAAKGPRLERVSLVEVELVTRDAPRWASLLVKQEQKSATVRFVPLKQFNTRFASVRLLNAARVEGLAARTRTTLLQRGWRGIAIGDAGAIRTRSVVLYPNHRRATAMSLARQFGFQVAMRSSGREITVLLGRDAAKGQRGTATD